MDHRETECSGPVMSPWKYRGRFAMCSSFVIESALAGVSRRQTLRLAAGVVAGALTGVSRGAANVRPGLDAGRVFGITSLELGKRRTTWTTQPHSDGKKPKRSLLCQRRRG